MIVRYCSSAALGLVIAGGLLWLMQFLIDIGPTVFQPETRETRLSWLAARQPEVIDDAPEPPDRLPPPVEPPTGRPPGNGDELLWVDPPIVDVVEPSGDNWKPTGIVMTDGPLVAVMTVRPVYPARATSLGLAGYVIVQFDVDEFGGVINVIIVESSHRMFEKAALAAAQRSKFRPRVVDGVAVATTGVRKSYRFEMEQ